MSGSSRTGEAIISLDSVTKYYKGQVIGLNKVTSSMYSGTTGLLGPNGAGKSTYLKLATGQIKPNTGTVRVRGHNPFSNPSIFTYLGYCPEQDAFYRWMTLFEFVETLAKLRGFSRREAKIEARRAIETVGLSDIATTKRISAASKGMRQRIKIAQALIGDPDVLIMDEPLAGADPINRSAMMETIARLGKSGHSVIVSSHVLHEVERMASKIQLLYKGRLLAVGSVKKIRGLIYEQPHEVHIHTTQARELGAAIAMLPYVTGLVFSDPASNATGKRNANNCKDKRLQLVMVRTDKAREFYKALPKIAVDLKIPISRLETSDDSLEAVFKYLVK